MTIPRRQIRQQISPPLPPPLLSPCLIFTSHPPASSRLPFGLSDPTIQPSSPATPTPVGHLSTPMPMTEDTPRASVGFFQPTPQSGPVRFILKKLVHKFSGLTGSSSPSPPPASPALSSLVVKTQANLILPSPKKPGKHAASGERKNFGRKSSS